MKNILFLLAIVSSLFLTSCGQEDSTPTDNNSAERAVRIKSGRVIVSPDGFVVADDESELKTLLFQANDPKITIGTIHFYRLGKSDAAVAIVDYLDSGVSKNIALTMGNIYVGFSSSARIIHTISSGRRGLATTYNCGGSGCCYVGGTLDPITPLVK